MIQSAKYIAILMIFVAETIFAHHETRPGEASLDALPEGVQFESVENMLFGLPPIGLKNRTLSPKFGKFVSETDGKCSFFMSRYDHPYLRVVFDVDCSGIYTSVTQLNAGFDDGKDHTAGAFNWINKLVMVCPSQEIDSRCHQFLAVNFHE